MAINAFSEGLEHSFPLLVPDYNIKDLLQNDVCFNFVPLILNGEVDKLAKDGINRHNICYHWAGVVE